MKITPELEFVLRKIIQEQRVDSSDRRVIEDALNKSEQNRFTQDDLIALAKRLLGLYNLFEQFLE
tara:strand:+ start:1044 stop:1238 length:195 start_codon:yes stop_codon:yes gene_type:complete